MFGRVIAKFRGTNRKAKTPSSNVLSRVLRAIFVLARFCNSVRCAHAQFKRLDLRDPHFNLHTVRQHLQTFCYAITIAVPVKLFLCQLRNEPNSPDT